MKGREWRIQAESPEFLCLPFPLFYWLSEVHSWKQCPCEFMEGISKFFQEPEIWLNWQRASEWPLPLYYRISRYLYVHSVMCLYLWPEGNLLTALSGSILTETVAQIQHNKNVRSALEGLAVTHLGLWMPGTLSSCYDEVGEGSQNLSRDKPSHFTSDLHQ